MGGQTADACTFPPPVPCHDTLTRLHPKAAIRWQKAVHAGPLMMVGSRHGERGPSIQRGGHLREALCIPKATAGARRQFILLVISPTPGVLFAAVHALQRSGSEAPQQSFRNPAHKGQDGRTERGSVVRGRHQRPPAASGRSASGGAGGAALDAAHHEHFESKTPCHEPPNFVNHGPGHAAFRPHFRTVTLDHPTGALVKLWGLREGVGVSAGTTFRHSTNSFHGEFLVSEELCVHATRTEIAPSSMPASLDE